MAQIFEEIQTNYELVTQLLSVGSLNNMRTGDLIVVNNGLQSVPFRTGSSNQILVTDSSTTSHLNWKGAKTLIGFTASGQLLTSGPGGSLVTLGQGPTGFVLTVNASHMPVWSSPTSAVNLPTSGAISFDLYPGQITIRTGVSQGRGDFSYFSWNQAKYGTNMGLTVGNLIFYSTGTGATLTSYLLAGAGSNQLFAPTAFATGINTIPVSTYPTADSVYRISASGSVAISAYAFQLQFKNIRVPT